MKNKIAIILLIFTLIGTVNAEQIWNQDRTIIFDHKVNLFYSQFLSTPSFSGQQYNSQNSTADSAITIDSNSLKKKIHWWITLGNGASNISESNQISPCAGAFFHMELNHNVFSARITHDEGINLQIPNQQIFDCGILYGLGSHRDLWFGNISLGIAYTAITKRIYVRTDTVNSSPVTVNRGELFRGAGIAYQAQLFSKFSETSSFGLGLTFCGNINRSLSFFMVLLSLEIGSF